MRNRKRFLVVAAVSLGLWACAAPDEGNEPSDESSQAAEPAAGPATSESISQTSEAAPALASDETDLLEAPQARIFGSGTSCSPNPCRNGGTCVDLWNGYRCQCLPGTSGTQCQTGSVCNSYTPPANGKCYGFYCGLTQTQLASKLSWFARCNLPAAASCAGTLPKASGLCGRSVRTANILDSMEQLTPKIVSCIKSTPAVQTLQPSSACVDCYVTFEKCSMNNCLIECLAGDGSDCDKCQVKRGCFAALYSCSGLPNPF